MGMNGFDDLKVRFLGRFCYVPIGNSDPPLEGWCESMQVVAPKMHAAPTNAAIHNPRLIVPFGLIGNDPRKAAEMAFLSEETGKVSDYTEYFVWDLTGCVVTFKGAQDRDVFFEDTYITRFSEIAAAYPPGTLDLRPDPDIDANPEQSYANAVISVPSGRFASLPLRSDVSYKYVYDGSGQVEGKIGTKTLRDGMKLSLHYGDGPIQLSVRSWITGEKWDLVLNRSVQDSVKVSPVITISSTCGTMSRPPRDHEFAAYYDLLACDCPPENRIVPEVDQQGGGNRDVGANKNGTGQMADCFNSVLLA